MDQPIETTNQTQSTPLLFPLDCSDKINELCEALSAAQGEFPTIPKNAEVTVKDRAGKFLYSYKYADLTEIISQTRPAMSKHGLSFTQDYTKHRVLGVGIVTILFHKSGQYLKTAFVPCEVKGMNMKDVAGQFTYGKRISLTAALGISADEDMDAGSIEGGEGNQTTRKDTKPQPKQKPKNYAPSSQDNELDKALKSDPPPQQTKPMSPLQEIAGMVKRHNMADAMPEIILRISGGRCDNSKELSQEEIIALRDYIRMMHK